MNAPDEMKEQRMFFFDEEIVPPNAAPVFNLGRDVGLSLPSTREPVRHTQAQEDRNKTSSPCTELPAECYCGKDSVGKQRTV